MLLRMEIILIAVLAFIVELITLRMRLFHKLRSPEIQRRIGMPRIHHGYVGALFLLLTLVVPMYGQVLWIVGWALVVSDLAHHYTVLPLLKITETDTHMRHGQKSRAFFIRMGGVVVSAIIVIAMLTSLSTSLWLVAMALGMLYVSERLHILLPKVGCPQKIASHF